MESHPNASIARGEQCSSGFSTSWCVWRTDSNAAWHSRDNCASLKFIAVCGQDLDGNWPLSLRDDIDESDNSDVRETAKYCEFTEILVQRDENSAVRECSVQYLFVSRISRPVTHLIHIVTGCDQIVPSATPCTAIEEHPHDLASLL